MHGRNENERGICFALLDSNVFHFISLHKTVNNAYARIDNIEIYLKNIGT